jgi:hypothetical protein
MSDANYDDDRFKVNVAQHLEAHKSRMRSIVALQLTVTVVSSMLIIAFATAPDAVENMGRTLRWVAELTLLVGLVAGLLTWQSTDNLVTLGKASLKFQESTEAMMLEHRRGRLRADLQAAKNEGMRESVRGMTGRGTW